MLDLALILQLADRCAPQAAPQTLAAIAYAESRFDPLAIGVNRGPRPARPARDAGDAARMTRALLAQGANLDLGVAQINSANLAWLGLSVEAAFDPCRNLSAAATVLANGFDGAAADPQTALRVALSRYNTGDARRGFRNGYVARVERAAVRLGLTSPGAPLRPSDPPPPVILPEPPAPAWDVFGRAPAGGIVLFHTRHPGEFR